MAAASRVILITGGNRGIGFATAAELLADKSNHVIIGSRKADSGEAALNDLRSLNLPGSVEMVELDVSSRDSIVSARKKVEEEHNKLDGLVNNAGIASFPATVPVEEQMRETFLTNCIGPVMVVEEFGPLLKKTTTTARIVNVSSGVGSITNRFNKQSPLYNRHAVHYRSSKTALNMITACQAVEFGQQGMKVFAYCPGFTVSGLGPHNTAANGAKPTSEGARPIAEILSGKRDAEHEGFLTAEGQLPW